MSRWFSRGGTGKKRSVSNRFASADRNFKKRMAVVMVELTYSTAAENDIDFIRETYQENIASLHGNHRTNDDWRELLSDKSSQYYIVRREMPVAWFRIDMEDGELWIGMIQVKPMVHRQGVGRYILSAAESIAGKKGIQRIGIHTTEDNIAARRLYLSAGYEVTEIGPCTTADGMERVGYTYQKGI